MARPAFRLFAGKIQNGTKAAALVWQLRTALEHHPEGAVCFLCYSWCTSFIGSAAFVSAALGILSVACIPRGGLFEKGISLRCWNNLGPYG